jgi:hypothetical protein
MDVNDLRSWVTVLSLPVHRHRRLGLEPFAPRRFDEAAQLPFADDAPTRRKAMSDFVIERLVALRGRCDGGPQPDRLL